MKLDLESMQMRDEAELFYEFINKITQTLESWETELAQGGFQKVFWASLLRVLLRVV
mgnify:CR=1 FL=1